MEVSSQRNRLKGVWGGIIKAGMAIQSLEIPLHSAFIRKIGSGTKIKFWTDNWLGQFCLTEKFPRLFALESEQTCMLSQKIVRVGDNCSCIWTWRINPRGGREETDLQLLIKSNQGISLSDRNDGWRWMLDKSEVFTVSSIRTLIDRKIQPSNNPPTSWRASLNRIATRANLDLKGIDLHSLLCPFCDNHVESLDHYLFYATHQNHYGSLCLIGGVFKCLY